MQIQRAGFLQHTVQFEEAHGHHGEVGHHVVFAQETPHGAQHVGGVGIATRHHPVEGAFGDIVPVPGVLEGLDLGLGLLAARRLEQHIVIGVRVERRVEIDQIDTGIRHVLTQHLQVVTVIKSARHRHPRIAGPHRSAPRRRRQRFAVCSRMASDAMSRKVFPPLLAGGRRTSPTCPAASALRRGLSRRWRVRRIRGPPCRWHRVP